MIRDASALEQTLERIDGRGYGAYRELEGKWDLDGRTLVVDRAQRDPFAAPSRVRLRLPGSTTRLPPEVCASGPRAVGTSCLLARTFSAEARSRSKRRGSGRSGTIRIEHPGQQVIANSAVRVEEDGGIEARFRVGLPAKGRRILGTQARQLLLGDVLDTAKAGLVAGAFAAKELRRHADTNEDAACLRAALAALRAIAFVADGAILPRRSGVDDRPLEAGRVVPFRSPDSLRRTVDLPNRGVVTGMVVPVGVTVIVGGGYHGKSTLLRAIQSGVYDHRPGDGREYVVSTPDAVKVRGEDGRSVAGVDISGFIGPLPGGRDTRSFSTPNASGSTSQAAAIVEAIESGASALLVDEDTAATNFLIRDRRMQELVPREREPITPLIDRVRSLHEEEGVSTVLALGGSGDYLDVADTVIAMTDFVPSDATSRAREVAREHPTHRLREHPDPLPDRRPRCPVPESIDPARGRRPVHIRVRSPGRIEFGNGEIDLSQLEQIVSGSQARAIAEALVWARRHLMEEAESIPHLLDRVMTALESEGLDVLGRGDAGDLTLFRRHELAAALNRLRTLEVSECA